MAVLAIAWLTGGLVLAAVVIAFAVTAARWAGWGPLSRSVACVVRHSPSWYCAARVPTGFADWTEVVCCPRCGDRWCRNP